MGVLDFLGNGAVVVYEWGLQWDEAQLYRLRPEYGWCGLYALHLDAEMKAGL